MAIVRVIASSVVAHAALLAVLAAFVDGAPRLVAAKRAPSVELVEPIRSVEPIEVVMIPPAVTTPPLAIATSVVAPSSVPSSVPRSRPDGPPTTQTAIATTMPSIVEVPPGTAVPSPSEPMGTGHGWNMRRPDGPKGPDLVIHEDVPHEAPTEQPAPKTESKLQQDGTGYVAPDLVTTMHVSPDGRASFVDKPDIEVHVTIPTPSLKGIGDHLRAWYRDPYAQTRARKYQDMPRHEQAVPGGWDAGAGGDTNIDGSLKQPEQAPRVTDGTVPLIGGTLDITSWLHRKFIGDPYSSRKRVLLDGTQAERAQIRANHTREQLDHSAQLMQSNVARIFSELHDPAERRAALFALWDECAEGDGAAGEAGQRARAMVIGAIRTRLSGAADRFSVEEIASLDAKRTSEQHFVPYD